MTGTGRVYFKSHTSIFTYRLIDQSFDQSDGRNGQRDTSLPQQTSGRITWLIYQQRGGYPYWRTQIKGWRGRAVSISNQRHQYSPIDLFINQLIYQQTDKTDGGTHQCCSRHQDALPDWSINRYLETPINVPKLTDGPCLFQISYINIHLLINWLINWLIYQRTDEMDGGTHL